MMGGTPLGRTGQQCSGHEESFAPHHQAVPHFNLQGHSSPNKQLFAAKRCMQTTVSCLHAVRHRVAKGACCVEPCSLTT